MPGLQPHYLLPAKCIGLSGGHAVVVTVAGDVCVASGQRVQGHGLTRLKEDV